MLAGDDAMIGAADAAMADAEQRLVRPDLRPLPLLDPEVARPVIDGRAHQFMTSASRTGRSSWNDFVPASTPATAQRPSIPLASGSRAVADAVDEVLHLADVAPGEPLRPGSMDRRDQPLVAVDADDKRPTLASRRSA